MDIGPKLRRKVDDVAHDADIATKIEPTLSLTPVADVTMPLTVSEIAAAQKTDDFFPTVIATMGPPKLFFFEGEDGVLLSREPSIPELYHIVVPETPRPQLLYLAHRTKITAHPGRTRMFTRL